MYNMYQRQGGNIASECFGIWRYSPPVVHALSLPIPYSLGTDHIFKYENQFGQNQRFGKWCISHDIHIYFLHFSYFYMY